MIQRRAARFVTNRYHNRSSVSDMLEHLKWPTLEHRRKLARLMMMYKLSNNIVNVDYGDCLIQPQQFSRNMHPKSFQTISCRTNCRKESFLPRTIRDWNALPSTTVSAESLAEFKTLLANSA